jgi:hypothetical protein
VSNSDYPESFEKWWAEINDPKAPRIVQAKDYAFMAWQKGMNDMQDLYDSPANTAEAPKIQHILSRDQRDALVAANVFLATMQAGDENLFHRIQGVLNEISDMLYG